VLVLPGYVELFSFNYSTFNKDYNVGERVHMLKRKKKLFGVYESKQTIIKKRDGAVYNW